MALINSRDAQPPECASASVVVLHPRHLQGRHGCRSGGDSLLDGPRQMRMDVDDTMRIDDAVLAREVGDFVHDRYGPWRAPSCSRVGRRSSKSR